MATTLLQLSGTNLTPARLSEAVFLLIDMQNEYFDGPIALPGAVAATAQAATLLTRARALGSPVIHIRHRGRAGAMFDFGALRGAIHADLTPIAGEALIDKDLPNSFAGTTLADTLAAHPGKPLIVAGFMTHMCVSATVRAALDHGRFSTVLSDGTATRDLPDPLARDTTISADTLHRISLAALSDRFAVIATCRDIKD